MGFQKLEGSGHASTGESDAWDVEAGWRHHPIAVYVGQTERELQSRAFQVLNRGLENPVREFLQVVDSTKV